MRKPENLQGALICENCRERIGESIAMGESVVSLRSNIPRGGYGLFTLVDRLPGECVTNYGGEIMHKMAVADAVARRLPVSHVMKLTQLHSISGLRNYRVTVPGVCWKGLAQFINRWSVASSE